MRIRLDRRSTASVSAALRYYQQSWDDHQQCRDIVSIATDGGCLDPLDLEEIGDLCERIDNAKD